MANASGSGFQTATTSPAVVRPFSTNVRTFPARTPAIASRAMPTAAIGTRTAAGFGSAAGADAGPAGSGAAPGSASGLACAGSGAAAGRALSHGFGPVEVTDVATPSSANGAGAVSTAATDGRTTGFHWSGLRSTPHLGHHGGRRRSAGSTSWTQWHFGHWKLMAGPREVFGPFAGL